MPVLAFFAVVGSVLVALLFAADATLENSSPVIVTSQRTGGAPVSQCDKNAHHCTSTRTRYDLASCTRCSAQVGA
jgi:hypothetical protein